MAARVLNEVDLRHTLSTVAANAKKKKKKNKSIRNTLTLPCKQFWPEVPESDSTDIKTLLQKNFPWMYLSTVTTLPRLLPAAKIVRKMKKVGWQIEKKMSREKRIAYRQELKKATLVPEDRKYLLLGHRSVSRAVEGNHASCCIVSGDVQPKMMTTGILSACQHNSIPVIVLSGLQDITRHTLTFPAIALAFKKYVSEAIDNKFHPIYKRVAELAKQLSSSSDLHDKTSENDESNLGNEMINGKLQTKQNCTKHKDRNGIENKNETSTKPYKYLYLNSDGRRAFIPEREPPVNIESSNKQMNFISLSTNGDNSNPKSNRKRQFEESEQYLIGPDDEFEDEEMDIDANIVPPVVEARNGVAKPKNKKIKRMPRYFPVNIKTVTSNPRKVVKPKRIKRIIY